MAMTLGFIGLGRMGLPMARLLAQDHRVIGFDTAAIDDDDITIAADLKTLVSQLPSPRTLWLMIPADGVPSLLQALLPLLEEEDIVIDGGNSSYQDSLRHGEMLAQKSMHFVCIGCSGGLEGAAAGPPMSVSCSKETLDHIEPLLKSLGGNYSYLAPPAFGHLAKGIHNAIEYGMMQSIADGIALYANQGFSQQEILQVLNVWSKGSIIESRLLDNTIECLQHHKLRDQKTISKSETLALIKSLCEGQQVPSIDAAIKAREEPDTISGLSMTVLALLRQHFGGHDIDDKGNHRQ